MSKNDQKPVTLGKEGLFAVPQFTVTDYSKFFAAGESRIDPDWLWLSITSLLQGHYAARTLIYMLSEAQALIAAGKNHTWNDDA